jgi:hypothetical protein
MSRALHLIGLIISRRIALDRLMIRKDVSA